MFLFNFNNYLFDVPDPQILPFMWLLREALCKVILRNTEINDSVDCMKKHVEYEVLTLYHHLKTAEDSKIFIDRPMIGSLETVRKDFEHFKKENGMFVDNDINDYIRNNLTTVEEKNSFMAVFDQFVIKHYAVDGMELEKRKPEDWSPINPEKFGITNKTSADMLVGLNDAWEDMSVIYKKLENTGLFQTTSIHVEHPFIIPGGRFKEMYYWDSYWVIKGLLSCGMLNSAKNMIDNFINLIGTIGYMPNGTREYYRNRSQPPMFPSMLLMLYLHDREAFKTLVLQNGLSAAVKEYIWFDTHRKVVVRINGEEFSLNQYCVNTDFPRPESFKEDRQTARDRKGVDAKETFSNLKTAAESGWDFSTRWLRIEGDLSSICIRDVIPVDLNVLLYLNELILSYLFSEVKQTENAKKYKDLAKKREEAMNKVLWNSKMGVWNDYNFIDGTFSDKRFFFSNIMPLFVNIEIPEGLSFKDILRRYENELFSYVGGIPASGPGNVVSKEQWDFPNAWAPHQSMMVTFLNRMGLKNIALHTARSFFGAVLNGYEKTKLFYEKYHCENTEVVAGGGEYATQTGFGWTNGTVLDFYVMFGPELDPPFNFQESFAKVKEILRSPVEPKSYDKRDVPVVL